ncbi:MAG: efflux transporter periplasmic adaptor subunit, partial [Caulobacterales bacterium]
MPGLVRRFGFAAVVAAVLALMAVIIVVKTILPGGGSAGAAAAGGGHQEATVVVAAPAETRRFTDAVQALGNAQAFESIVITPKVADVIRTIRFDSGDRVARGQVLVELTNV